MDDVVFHRLHLGGDAGTVLEVGGEIDVATVHDMREALAIALSEPGRGTVVVDLSAVTFMGACGLQALLAAGRVCSAVNRRLVLRDPSRCVLRLIEISRLESQFEIHWSTREPVLHST